MGFNKQLDTPHLSGEDHLGKAGVLSSMDLKEFVFSLEMSQKMGAKWC